MRKFYYMLLLIFTLAYVKTNSDTCLSCRALDLCEPVVCTTIFVNGTSVINYVQGCELACPNGRLVCKQTSDGTLSWTPQDPCLKFHTDATNKGNGTMYTFDKKAAHTNASRNTSNGLASKPSDLIAVTPSNQAEDKLSKIFEVTIQPKPSSNSLSVSTLAWIVSLISIILLSTCSTICCVIVKIHQKHYGKVKFSAAYTNGRLESAYGDIIKPTFSRSQLYFPRMSTEIPARGHGHIYNVSTSNINAKTKMDTSSPSSLRRKLRSKHRASQASPKSFNWQESGTQEFIIPPSPRSIIDLTFKRNYSEANRKTGFASGSRRRVRSRISLSDHDSRSSIFMNPSSQVYGDLYDGLSLKRSRFLGSQGMTPLNNEVSSFRPHQARACTPIDYYDDEEYENVTNAENAYMDEMNTSKQASSITLNQTYTPKLLNAFNPDQVYHDLTLRSQYETRNCIPRI